MAIDRLELMTLEEAAAWLKVDPDTLKGWASSGLIPVWQPRGKGGKLLFPRQIIEDWIRGESRARVEPAAKPIPKYRPQPQQSQQAPKGALPPIGAADDW